MKIYRAYITYNNGDYNEWEEVYKAESPWYTSREEAEKHFFELTRLRDWLRYKNRENGSFNASDPDIEEQELITNDVYSPMEIIHTKCSTEVFELSKFKYIEEMPSLDITKTVLASSFSSPGISPSFFVRIADTELMAAITKYEDEEYYIIPSDFDANKFHLYSEEIKNAIVNTVKEKVVNIVLPIQHKIDEAWKIFHDEKEQEVRTWKWHYARFLEMHSLLEACKLLNAEVSDHTLDSIKWRLENIQNRWCKDDAEEIKKFSAEIEAIHNLVNYCESIRK